MFLYVKPDVDMEKELPKFHFKKQGKKYGYGWYRCLSAGVQVIFVCCDEADRMILVDKWVDGDPRLPKNPYCKYRSYDTVYTVIYQLTKAGLLTDKLERKCKEE